MFDCRSPTNVTFLTAIDTVRNHRMWVLCFVSGVSVECSNANVRTFMQYRD
jgi:hypothetical protein